MLILGRGGGAMQAMTPRRWRPSVAYATVQSHNDKGGGGLFPVGLGLYRSFSSLGLQTA